MEVSFEQQQCSASGSSIEQIADVLAVDSAAGELMLVIVLHVSIYHMGRQGIAAVGSPLIDVLSSPSQLLKLGWGVGGLGGGVDSLCPPKRVMWTAKEVGGVVMMQEGWWGVIVRGYMGHPLLLLLAPAVHMTHCSRAPFCFTTNSATSSVCYNTCRQCRQAVEDCCCVCHGVRKDTAATNTPP